MGWTKKKRMLDRKEEKHGKNLIEQQGQICVPISLYLSIYLSISISISISIYLSIYLSLHRRLSRLVPIAAPFFDPQLVQCLWAW